MYKELNTFEAIVNNLINDDSDLSFQTLMPSALFSVASSYTRTKPILYIKKHNTFIFTSLKPFVLKPL